MVLAKLNIWREVMNGQFGVPVPVLFNPNQLTMGRAANWKAAEKPESETPTSQFTHSDPTTLNLELFFDTYEQGIDVRTQTLLIFDLTKVRSKMHRPPRCRLHWGLYDFEGAEWVLERVEQTFTLFLSTGLPARATLSCSFKQWRSGLIESLLLNLMSADVPKTHVVRQGDRLSTIAAREYQDPALWREIATANDLDDPLNLTPGQALRIPPLTHRRSSRA
jgi:nucleoid-associated protein YgaU